MIKLSDRVYYTAHNDETDRPVLGYVRGDRYALMVDAGNSSKHAELFLQSLREERLPYPDYVAITHWHWDHIFGMDTVRAKAITNTLTDHRLKKMQLWKWDDASMDLRAANGEESPVCNRNIRKELPDRSGLTIKSGDIVYDSRLTVDLGGVHCELIHVGGCHSEDCSVVFVPEEKVLFIGDADCGGSKTENPLEKTEKLLALFESLDFELCVCGHTEHEGRHDFLASLREDIEQYRRESDKRPVY